MEIEVWSVGKAKFTADTEYQEPMIREAIDQRGDVASVIIDYTDSERSDISYDEYARVTGDIPDLVLFEGWLTGDRNAPPPAASRTDAGTVSAATQADEGAFWAWMDAYVDEPHNASYEVPDMQRAYEAGQADGQWTVAELAAALDSFYAWFTVVGGGARVQGQLLGADADEFARVLHAQLDANRAHRDPGP